MNPPREPPVAPAPHPDRILRGIAAFKFVKALVLVAAGLGALELLSPARAAVAERWALSLAWRLDRGAIPALQDRMDRLRGSSLTLLGVAAFCYAALFVTEGVGLWNGKRWAEYLTIIATSSLIPFELFEVTRRATAPRLFILGINLLVVGYLIWKVRQRGPAPAARGV